MTQAQNRLQKLVQQLRIDAETGSGSARDNSTHRRSNNISSSRCSTRTSTPASAAVDLDYCIKEDYLCRLIRASDYDSIVEICESIYGGNDFLQHSILRWLPDTHHYLCVGLEHKPSKKLIATRIAYIIDGGVTAFMLGGRVHEAFRGQGLYTPFKTWMNSMVVEQYPAVHRFRASMYSSNAVSLHLSASKAGAVVLPGIGRFSWLHIGFDQPRHGFHAKYFMERRQFESRMSTLLRSSSASALESDVKAAEKNDSVLIRKVMDIDTILDAMQNVFHKNEVTVDWKVFDLKVNANSVSDAEMYMKKEMNAGRLEAFAVAVNADDDEEEEEEWRALGLLYTDERNFHQCYVYVAMNSKRVNIVPLHALLQFVYNNWRSKANTTKNEELMMFVDNEIVQNSKAVQSLVQGMDCIVITERIRVK